MTQTVASNRSARARAAWLTGIVLTIAVVCVLLISSAAGQYATTPIEVLSSIKRVVFDGAEPTDNPTDAALWTIRFPRALLAAVIGASLALAGTVMQGIFANPLAEPSVVGVSAGASVGACLAIVFGYTSTGSWVLPVSAFIGAMTATACVWMLAKGSGKVLVLTLVLTGIAINAIGGALTSFLVYLGDTSSREEIIFWQMGSLTAARWEQVGVCLAVLAVAALAIWFYRNRLDVLALGDAAAHGTGINVERLRFISVILVCILTGTAVAFSGMIGFVGLVVPHALRLIVGPSHKYLVPLSLLGGATLLGLADTAARTLIPLSDIPVGVFTALVGGPVFIVLLRGTLKKGGIRS